ncbi:sulfite exporter TauE/SafE family protein [Vagococcus sp.]|uniref:sulfite exporter TauE/SafE family protein n=1 Tax=Vagococcus sp. TaxID=1933889 RepID=UPI003F9C809F
MKIGLLYSLIIIIANSVGAISGMGGGVIIKPMMDFASYHTISEISFFSTVAVFTMSIVSTQRQIKKRVTIDWLFGLQLSLGAILGGVLGNVALKQLLIFFSDERHVKSIQIIITILTLFFSYLYSLKNRWKFEFKHPLFHVSVGFFLGFLASLLGIGGGPINVAVLILFFGLEIKKATVYSIIIIFFSQGAKIINILLTTNLIEYDLLILLFIIPAAICGGYLGAILSRKMSNENVINVYRIVIILVLLINIYNLYQILVSYY